MELKSYEARSISQTVRVVGNSKAIAPKAPCGMSVPPGWVLSNGRYIRETEYLAIHQLAYLRDKLTA